MLLAPDGVGFRRPNVFATRQCEIMSFDFKQHPTDRVRLSTRLQRPDHAAARTSQGFSVLCRYFPRKSSIAAADHRPMPDFTRALAVVLKSWETKTPDAPNFG
jgi:hypothetical protein